MPDKIAAVSGYFRKRGAYARCKDLLESHDLLERWYHPKVVDRRNTKRLLDNLIHFRAQ